MLRHVVGDRVTGLSGPRALLVMAAHPVAFAGFFAHTGALDDPYARLERTATVMNAIAFGTRAHADRMTTHVRAMHRRVRGDALASRPARSPPARPTAATTPSTCCGSSARWRSRRCSSTASTPARSSRDEKDELWRDYRVVGRLFGLRERDMPRGHRRLRGLHGRALREPGAGRDAAGARAGDRHRAAPAGAAAPAAGARAGQPDHGRAAAAAGAPRSTASRWDPVRAVALHGGAEYVKRVVVPVLPERMRMLPLARAA